jgi:hypothetical protein
MRALRGWLATARRCFAPALGFAAFRPLSLLAPSSGVREIFLGFFKAFLGGAFDLSE